MNCYEYLSKINKYVCKDSHVRTKHLKVFTIIDNAIEDALASNDEMDIFNKAIRAAALIKLYQPFRDGNNRTGIIVFGNIISEKAYIFDYTCALYDSKVGKLKIPTIFDKNDIVSFPSTWEKYISKYKKPKEINIKQLRC